VLGVSPDNIGSHRDFSISLRVSYNLLSDEDKKVAKKYGIWKEKNLYGKKYMGIVRSTFIIDKNGKIAHIFPKVKVDGHTEEVLKVLKKLNND
jgi:peroxiredoxin Q/BCP